MIPRVGSGQRRMVVSGRTTESRGSTLITSFTASLDVIFLVDGGIGMDEIVKLSDDDDDDDDVEVGVCGSTPDE